MKNISEGWASVDAGAVGADVAVGSSATTAGNVGWEIAPPASTVAAGEAPPAGIEVGCATVATVVGEGI